MKKLRVFTFLLSTTLLLGTFTGCGSEKKDTAAKPAETKTDSKDSGNPYKDKVEISMAGWDLSPESVDPSKDALFGEISKKLNISIKATALSWDDYQQKIQVWAASGQLPDVFAIDAIGSKFRNNWIKNGTVKALPTDLSKYPNLNKNMTIKDVQDLKIDGKHYCIPRQTFDSLKWNVMDRVLFYRADWAQKLGIQEPKTFEDLSKMFTAFAKNDPEGKHAVGLTVANTKLLGYLWLPFNPAAISDGSGTDFKWIKEDGKWVPAFFSKNTLPGLKAVRKMYEDGGIDKDLALLKGTEGLDKFASGRAGAYLCAGGGGPVPDKFEKANPDKKFFDVVKIAKIPAATDGKIYQPTFKTYWSESYINGKVDDKKMERILALYDYLISQEGRELLRFGLKDVDYTKDGNKITPKEPGKDLSQKYPSMKGLKNMPCWDDMFWYSKENPQGRKDYIENMNKYLEWGKTNTQIPEFDLRLSLLSTPTKDKMVILDHEEMVKAMLSKEPVEKVWEDIVKTYEGKGLNKMIEEVNEAAKKLK